MQERLWQEASLNRSSSVQIRESGKERLAGARQEKEDRSCSQVARKDAQQF